MAQLIAFYSGSRSPAAEFELAGAGVAIAAQDPPGRRLRRSGNRRFGRDIRLLLKGMGRVLHGLMGAPHVAQGRAAQSQGKEAEKGDPQT